MWDVFLLDSGFKIERPTRYYRQGFNLLHPEHDEKEIVGVQDNQKMEVQYDHQSGFAATMGTINSRMSKILHLGGHKGSRSDDALHSTARPRAGSASSGSSNSSSEPEQALTPMLDPSTNINTLQHPNKMNESRLQVGKDDKKKKKRAGDVSKHTFYIENSQMRLKLFARNEVSFLTSQYVAGYSSAVSGIASNAAVDHGARESSCSLTLHRQQQV